MLKPRMPALAALMLLAASAGADVLFREDFDDTDYASRGWYDGGGPPLTTGEHVPGSPSAAELVFLEGARTPVWGGAMRQLFPGSSSVYLSYWLKYSAGWQGSNRPYHPHEFHFITDVDGMWIGPAATHLTLYIEQNEGEPLLAIQDALNIDEARIGEDLTAVTELRAVAGCNGDSDGHGDGDCYLAGSTHRNGKGWRAGFTAFGDAPGRYYKADWHLVEASFELNGIAAGVGTADGRIRYWLDGELLIDHADVMLRTGQWPAMLFNQFLMAPYIGDGSPVEQTMWVDDLKVATERTHGLLRNDAITTLAPLAPPLDLVFSGRDLASLERRGMNGVADEGEAGLESASGSGDDDDYYLADCPEGSLDPDARAVVPDASRPLIFYQLDSGLATLQLVKDPAGSPRFSY